MPNELVHQPGGEIARQTGTQDTGAQLMAIIAAVAANPDSDVAKMRELLEMRRLIMKDDAAIAFNQAMSAAQEEMRPVVRDAVNASNNSRYARLETIDAAIRPVYIRHGFALTFNSPLTDASGVTVACTVLHSAGHSKDYTLSGGLDTMGPAGKPNKTAIQGLGSSVSYLKRYLTAMVFNVILADKDDDAQSADPINKQQANDIDQWLSLLAMTPTQAERFWAWVGPPAVNVGSIQKRDYDRVAQWLKTRVSAQGGGK